jgi:hypothetical protein
MKKIICKVEYDTEVSTIVKKFTVGEFGDSKGYEETLYISPSEKYFIYVNGGADSLYPTEDIKRLSKAKAEEWLKEHN